MRKKIIWIVVIILMLIAIFSKGISKDANNEFKPIDINIGDKFTYFSYPKPMYILNYCIEDISGDNKNDLAILIGEKENVTYEYANNIDVVIYNVSTKSFLKTDLKGFNGSNIKLTVADVNGDSVGDVIAYVEKDNEHEIRIVTSEQNKLTEIFKSKDNYGLQFEGKYIDGFKINLFNTKLDKEIVIDISDRKDNYIAFELYDDNGKLLKENMRVTTSNFVTFETVQLNDRTGISTTQRIYGINNTDIIDDIKVVWKYEDGKWQVKEAKGSKMGNLLY